MRGKVLRLTCWNAERVWGRKLELEHFLSQNRVDICLLSETFLNSGQAFRLATMSATAQTDQQPVEARPYWFGVLLLTTRYRCPASPSWRQMP